MQVNTKFTVKYRRCAASSCGVDMSACNSKVQGRTIKLQLCIFTNGTYVLFIPLKLIRIYSVHIWQLAGRCRKLQINSAPPPALHMGATSNYMSRFDRFFFGGVMLPHNGLTLNFLPLRSLDFRSRKTMLKPFSPL